jgi:hypothetical protein
MTFADVPAGMGSPIQIFGLVFQLVQSLALLLLWLHQRQIARREEVAAMRSEMAMLRVQIDSRPDRDQYGKVWAAIQEQRGDMKTLESDLKGAVSAIDERTEAMQRQLDGAIQRQLDGIVHQLEIVQRHLLKQS